MKLLGMRHSMKSTFKIIGERGGGKRRETCTGLGRAGEGREHEAAVFMF